MTILDFLYPKKCVGCNKTGQYFCEECKANILQTELVCPKCEKLSVGGLTHPVCRRKYGLEGLWSLGIYQDPLKKGIQKLKYRFIKELGEILIDTTIEYWARYQPLLLEKIIRPTYGGKKSRGEGWIVTAVPLHKSRQNWRGFNQSELLAKLLASKLGLKYENLLVRTRKTKPQVTLKGPDRHKNIKGAFQLSVINFQFPINVILVDDVWTTGSTLRECCFVLKRGGAKGVWALTLAR